MRAALFWLGLVLCVGLPAGLIAQKEHLLSQGRVVLLRLAPVDPRSLMQGDYMDLRYRLAADVADATEHLDDPPRRGLVVVRVAPDDTAEFVRVDGGQPLADGEARLQFHRRGGTVRFGAESYFFQEGHGAVYEKARYGELRVDDEGVTLLAALRDEDRNRM